MGVSADGSGGPGAGGDPGAARDGRSACARLAGGPGHRPGAVGRLVPDPVGALTGLPATAAGDGAHRRAVDSAKGSVLGSYPPSTQRRKIVNDDEGDQ